MALFGNKEKTVDIIPDIMKDLANVRKRVMLIEKDFYIDRMTISKINDSITQESNTFLDEAKNIKIAVAKLRKEINHLKLSLKNTIGEIKKSVTINEVQTLKDRVDAWNPESFVTVEEAEHVLRKALEC